MRTLLFIWLVTLFFTALSSASEDDFVPWHSIILDCGTVEKAGKVLLTAAVDESGYKKFEITAFGRNHSLSVNELKQLQGFPLEGMVVTCCAGRKIDEFSISFHLKRVFYDKEGVFRNEKMVVSVDETHKATVFGPRAIGK